jgi:hypothetical protein
MRPNHNKKKVLTDSLNIVGGNSILSRDGAFNIIQHESGKTMIGLMSWLFLEKLDLGFMQKNPKYRPSSGTELGEAGWGHGPWPPPW